MNEQNADWNHKHIKYLQIISVMCLKKIIIILKIAFPKHMDTHSALLDFILTEWIDYLTKVDGSTTKR